MRGLCSRFVIGFLLFGGPPSSTVSLSLAEVAGELDGETLRRLKRECGGLQTLLRNSPQVFRGEGLARRPRSPFPSVRAGRAASLPFCSPLSL